MAGDELPDALAALLDAGGAPDRVSVGLRRAKKIVRPTTASAATPSAMGTVLFFGGGGASE